MEFPLSRQEHRYIKQIEEKYKEGIPIIFTRDELLRYSDILELMCEKGVICDAEIAGADAFLCLGGFDGFKEWIDIQNKKAKKIKRREWMIAIFSTVLGFVLGLSPTILEWLF